MTQFDADRLIRRIEAERRWPPPFDHGSISEVARRAAFREADEETLRRLHDWSSDRPYVVDPIGDRIAIAKADLLYGEDPRVRAKTDSDQGNLERIIEKAELPSELHYAEQLRASEGEVWWRVEHNEAAGCPIPTFHSREVVVPLYLGPTLIAAAFVSEFIDPADESKTNPKIWRHLEIQTFGRIENRLYLGTKDHLGEGKDLDAFSETMDLDTVWEHGIPAILAGRIIFRRGRRRELGRSVYVGNEHLMLALNEAMTIGTENVRLTAKKRAVVPASALRQRDPLLPPNSIDAGDGTRVPVASFDAGEDLLVAGDDIDTELGKEGSGASSMFRVLEYSFDAESLIEWQDKLVKVLASRCGLTVEFMGEGESAGQGSAESGTALRVKLLPATSSARGAGRSWDDALPRILLLCQLLDNAQQSVGGFGRSYRTAGDAPSVERQDPLPRDETEEVARHSTAVGGPVESIQTAVKALHPDWDEDQVKEEVEAIREDVQTANSFVGLGALPAGGNPEPPDNPPPTPEPGQ